MGFLKNVFTAVTSGNLKRGLEAAEEFGPTPAEVAAAIAQARAAQAPVEPVDDGTRVLLGPAGERLYGDDVVAAAFTGGSNDDIKDAIRGALDVDDPQVEDLSERAAVAAAERADRALARQPYLPADAQPVAFARVPTRGASQIEQVLEWLRAHGLAARPDHVFGVYRVPDRISPSSTSYSESGRLVEWDVVYRPLDGSASASAAPVVPLASTSFIAADRWVSRRVGEPSLLDEDLALEFCLRAGIGPELCLGIARVPEFRTLRFGGDHDDYMRTIVKGVVALHPEEHSSAYLRMRDEAPLSSAVDPAAVGVHVAQLDWEAIAKVVHPKMHEPPSVPSPFPYLPSTPDELLRAYLEVVGVSPADCYSAQATVDRMRQLVPGGFLTSEQGRRQPCADGKERTRLHACEYVIVVYRDSPAYVSGRERWEAYQREVLFSHLERGVRARPPVEDPGDMSYIPAGLRTAVRVGEVLSNLELVGQEQPPPFRYCWPPGENPGFA